MSRRSLPITLGDLPPHWRDQVLQAKRNREPASVEAPKPKRTMNGLESGYAKHLDMLKAAGEIQWWKYECLRLVIADGEKKAYYKPDFMVQTDSGLEFHETKGWWKTDARLRIKVAAGLYPWARFVGVQKVKGAWVYEEFPS